MLLALFLSLFNVATEKIKMVVVVVFAPVCFGCTVVQMENISETTFFVCNGSVTVYPMVRRSS